MDVWGCCSQLRKPYLIAAFLQLHLDWRTRNIPLPQSSPEKTCEVNNRDYKATTVCVWCLYDMVYAWKIPLWIILWSLPEWHWSMCGFPILWVISAHKRFSLTTIIKSHWFTKRMSNQDRSHAWITVVVISKMHLGKSIVYTLNLCGNPTEATDWNSRRRRIGDKSGVSKFYLFLIIEHQFVGSFVTVLTQFLQSAYA